MATKNATLRNKMATDFAALWDEATLVIKDSGNVTLVTFEFGDPAFGSASNGAVSLAGLPISATAAATGTAAKAELISDGGTYTITDLTVGLSASQVILDNLSINSGQTVNLTAFSWTESASV